jgi:hypothetical protein
LKLIGEFDGDDRSYVFQISGDGTTLTNTHEWCAVGIEPMIDRVKDVSVELFPWFIAQMNRLDVVHIPRVADLPGEAKIEQQNSNHSRSISHHRAGGVSRRVDGICWSRFGATRKDME